MKFSTNRETLVDILKKLRPFVAQRSFLPVLQNVRVATFAEGQVALTATNLDVIGTITLAADVQEPGETTLPYTLLVSVLGEMLGEQVSFELGSKEQTVIKSELSESALVGTPAPEFPQTEFVITDAVTTFMVSASWLKQRMGQVMFAASSDDTRPVLSTVLFRVTGGALTMAGTDGFRLAIIDEPNAFGETAVGDLEILFPVVQMQGILHLLEGDVTVTVNCKRVRFETSTASAFVQLPDYEYPDYSSIIPKRVLTTLTLERVRAASAARLAMVIASQGDMNRFITLAHEQPDGEVSWLSMSSTVSAVGSNEARAALLSSSGNKFQKMGVNGGYFLDALVNAPAGDIEVRTTSPAEPIVIRSVADASWQCIIMPIYLKR